jgi:hypothetical protein
MTTITQDNAAFPQVADWVVHDHDLAYSWFHDIDTVPTLLRVVDGEPTERLEGWKRDDWEAFTGIDDLGADLPDWRPGCGSLSVDPNRTDELAVRFSGSTMSSRRVEIAALEDEWEALYDRDWSDGLPVVPPTEARVLRMLEGTTRAPDEIVAVVPPDLADVTVEKIAINAVMAGCRPDYLPVVIAAVEAICTDDFNMHGVLATTMDVGPIIIVNGPIAREIGMNSGGNVLGQGNRANATIGRAVQLVVRNVGGGKPGGVDRSAHGSPHKIGLAFAEDEVGSPWSSLAESRGFDADQSTVTCLVRRRTAGLRRSALPHAGVAHKALRQLSQDQSRPEDGDDGDPARDRPRAHVPVPRRRLGSSPVPRRTGLPSPAGHRRPDPRRRRHRRRPARSVRRQHDRQVLAGRHPRGARRWGDRPVLDGLQWLGSAAER